MDVTCERCNTEYEFDDALVSGRGTTVQCTQCGHRFKVRRAEGGASAESWVVRTVDGRELEFTALRELQAAIASAFVGRDDVLARAGSRPRRLGSIAELEPFFANTGETTSHSGPFPGAPVRQRIATPVGLGGPVPQTTEGSVAIPLPSVSREAAPGHAPGPRGGGGGSYDDEATATLPVGARAVTVPMPDAIPQAVAIPPPVPPPPRPGSMPPADLTASRSALPTPLPPPPATAHRRTPLPAEPRAPGSPREAGAHPPAPSVPPLTPTPAEVRASYAEIQNEPTYSEPRFSSMASTRRPSGGRWIVGSVLLGAVVLAGVAFGRSYLAQEAPAQGPTETDGRIGALLAAGERSLADGDLELAKEQFVKASALAEKDRRVLAHLARLQVIEADTSWLRLRLVAEDDPDRAVVERQVERAIARALEATDGAHAVAPEDPVVLRCRIDVLRMAGDIGGARRLVSGIASGAGKPENAYSLAALDLVEPEPVHGPIVDRLRAAAGAELGLGRARALLVYALARSGDVAAAGDELDKLAGSSRAHPLTPSLRKYVARLGGPVGAGESGERAGPPGSERPTTPGGDPARPADPSSPPTAAAASPAGAQAPPAGPGRAAPFADGRVPDDYVWPGNDPPVAVETPKPEAPPEPKVEPKPEPKPPSAPSGSDDGSSP